MKPTTGAHTSCTCAWDGCGILVSFPDRHTIRLSREAEQLEFLLGCGVDPEELEDLDEITECPARWRDAA